MSQDICTWCDGAQEGLRPGQDARAAGPGVMMREADGAWLVGASALGLGCSLWAGRIFFQMFV